MNHYDILECKKDSNFAEIKRSYQRLALRYHPDKEQTTDGLEMYYKIDEAWQILRDPEKRKIYDSELYELNFNEQSNVFAELNIDNDFTKNENGKLTYPCRCGDYYEIQPDDILNEEEIMLECNQCSLVVSVKR